MFNCLPPTSSLMMELTHSPIRLYLLPEDHCLVIKIRNDDGQQLRLVPMTLKLIAFVDFPKVQKLSLRQVFKQYWILACEGA
jgi:hypothetical protein